jgi:hypothetical protein
MSMKTKFIEATNAEHGGINWGKFLLARFEQAEWDRPSMVDNRPQLRSRGWTPDHLLVLDLQTGEGALFYPNGCAKADLDKHAVWVCPMFEPFLIWLWTQSVRDLDALPALVHLDAPSASHGYRRPGPDKRRKEYAKA